VAAGHCFEGGASCSAVPWKRKRGAWASKRQPGKDRNQRRAARDRGGTHWPEKIWPADSREERRADGSGGENFVGERGCAGKLDQREETLGEITCTERRLGIGRELGAYGRPGTPHLLLEGRGTLTSWAEERAQEMGSIPQEKELGKMGKDDELRRGGKLQS